MENTTESVKVSTAIMNRVRVIAKRDGMMISRLLERLIESGLKTEKPK